MEVRPLRKLERNSVTQQLCQTLNLHGESRNKVPVIADLAQQGFQLVHWVYSRMLQVLPDRALQYTVRQNDVL